MASAVPAVLQCEQPLTFEYRDAEKTFYICDPALGFLRSMPAEPFFATIVNAVECSRAHRPWVRPTAEVIDFADHQAASVSGRSPK